MIYDCIALGMTQTDLSVIKGKLVKYPIKKCQRRLKANHAKVVQDLESLKCSLASLSKNFNWGTNKYGQENCLVF